MIEAVTEGGTSEGAAIDDVLRVIAISSAVAAAALAVALRHASRGTRSAA